MDTRVNDANGGDGERHIATVADAMTEDAYKSHIGHLRFPGHSAEPSERVWDGRGDKLWKIRSIITTALSGISKGWTCYQELTVDESMIRVTSKRCTFIQYMPVRWAMMPLPVHWLLAAE
jgi:hypothetical protein